MAAVTKRGLVLWDIDKTLVDVGGVSRLIYEVAFEKVTGHALGELADMVGRTERAILIDTLALNGVSESRFDAFYDALGDAAEQLSDRMRADGRSLPGAGEAIAGLVSDDVIQSVATGNIRSIAETKLRAFDLADHIDFDVGGYGDDDGVRATLVRLARERASRKYDVDIPPGRVVVIGDTPLDIAGAHGAGAWAVGVATGQSRVHDLTAAGADIVFGDLTATTDLVNAVIAALLNGPET